MDPSISVAAAITQGFSVTWPAPSTDLVIEGSSDKRLFLAWYEVDDGKEPVRQSPRICSLGSEGPLREWNSLGENVDYSCGRSPEVEAGAAPSDEALSSEVTWRIFFSNSGKHWPSILPRRSDNPTAIGSVF